METQSPAAAGSPSSASKAAQQVQGFVAKYWPLVKPYVDWFWLNLRVWAPPLATPDFRQRDVAYPQRDYKPDDEWLVALPAQCYACGVTDGLTRRNSQVSLSSYESPAAICAVAAGVSAFFFLIAILYFSFYSLIASILAMLGGFLTLRLKGWREIVNFSASACPDHVDAPLPELVAHDEAIHVIVPTTKIVAAAKAEINLARQNRTTYAGPANEPRRSPAAPPPPSGRSPASPTPPAINPMAAGDRPPQRAEPAPYRRPELPPIKLDE